MNIFKSKFFLSSFILATLSTITTSLLVLNQYQNSSNDGSVQGVEKVQLFKVSRVIDGNTIVLENGEWVRYLGIQTPELVTNECYAKEAKLRNEELVLGKSVELKKDNLEKDKFQRSLRYVYVEGVNINKKLISEGFGRIGSENLDISEFKNFKIVEQEAQNKKAGLWGNCLNLQLPQEQNQNP